MESIGLKSICNNCLVGPDLQLSISYFLNRLEI